MEWTATVDLSLLNERIERLIEAAGDVSEPLLRCGGLLRARARGRFAVGGPGWAELSPETKKRKITQAEVNLLRDPGRGKTGQRSLVQRVLRDVKGLKKSNERITKLQERIAGRHAAGKDASSILNQLEMTKRQRMRRESFIRFVQHIADEGNVGDVVKFAEKEAARARRHGENLRIARLIEQGAKAIRAKGKGKTPSLMHYDSATASRGTIQQLSKIASSQYYEREAGKLAATLQAHNESAIVRRGGSGEEVTSRLRRAGQRRYKAEQSSTRILGALDRSISMKLIGQAVKVFSHSRSGGVHNYGGTAGHGAKIKARPFLFMTDSDVKKCAEIFSEYLTAAWLGRG